MVYGCQQLLEISRLDSLTGRLAYFIVRIQTSWMRFAFIFKTLGI
jgi:cytochrome c biogenesis factor